MSVDQAGESKSLLTVITLFSLAIYINAHMYSAVYMFLGPNKIWMKYICADLHDSCKEQ